MAFHGKQGKVTFAGAGNPVSGVLSWSIDATCDVAEGTVMDNTAVTANTHWKTYAVGCNDWTATVECVLDDSDALDPDLATDFIDEDGATLACHCSLLDSTPVTRKYSGNAIVLGISVSVDKDDVAKATYTLQGSGELSVTADET